MAVTPIRSSTQLFIDDNLDFKSKKGINLLAGSNAGDAVEFTQMNTAIGNAVSGVGNSIHIPVADLATSKTIVLADRADKMIMLIETLGLYRFDAEMIVASNDTTIIRPTDVASDAAAGRWIKISSTVTDHDNLSNILGNGTYHLSLTERDKLTNIEPLADVTSAAKIATAINGTTADTALVDADVFAILDSTNSFALKKYSFTSLKTNLKAYFDTVYLATGLAELLANKDASGGYVGLTLFKINFKNTANTFTSYFVNANTASWTYTFQNRTGTIADDTDITNAKARANHTGTQLASTISDFNAAALAAAPASTTTSMGTLVNGATAKATLVDADMVPIMDSAASNIIKKWSYLNLRTQIMGLFSSDISVTAAGVATISGGVVTNAKLATMATATIKGRNTAGTGAPEDITIAQLKTLIGLTPQATQTRTYRASLTGVINGSNTVFTVAALIVSGTEELFKNGQLMTAGAGLDYTIAYGATTTITFTTAPSAAGFVDTLLINYSV